MRDLELEDEFDKTAYSEKPVTDMHYIRPKEAERKIRMAAGINQSVWISGVSGTGKTSFIADYFKRRRYDYYAAKEVIPSRIVIPETTTNKGLIVVIDDLYGISDGEQQNEWMEIISKCVNRKDIWLILVSRSEIPVWLNSLAIEHIFYRINEEDMRLTRSQMDEYFSTWNLELKKSNIDTIWELSKGYPLSNKVVIMELMKGISEEEAIQTARSSVWNYLIVHVYEQWDTDMRECLMKLSLLGQFDMEMAIYMTGNSKVNVLLKNAIELGNFIARENEKWIIRKPMCLSMQQLLVQNYEVEYVKNLYIRAGDCFKINNNIMRALEMYEKAKSERSIAELLIQNARENPCSGHYYEMRHYYLRLPEEYIKQSVELMGAMCMIQSMLMNIEESERWYEELSAFAKNQTGALRKEAKNRLLYLDIALPHRGSADMITIMKSAGALLFNRKAKLPEFSVTSNIPSQMNGGKDFSEWSKKDKELVASIGKIVGMVLGKYGKGFICLALAESGFEKGEDNYEVETLAVRGRMEAETGGKLEQSFVGVGIIVWLSIFTNHVENANVTLDGFYEMAKGNVSQQLIKNYYALKCRLSLYQGQVTEIQEWMKEAPNENEEFYGLDRFRYLTKIRVYLADKKYEEAGILIQKMDYYAEVMERTYIKMELLILKAILFYRIGDDKWNELLQKAVTKTEEYHFVRLLSREGAALLPLLKKAKLEWKDEQFKKQVENEVNYMAEMYPGYLMTETEHSVLLSENAIKILRLQAVGKTAEQIAEQLNISVSTVKYHNKETYKKLGVKTKAQAINEAKNRKLL